MRQLILFMTLIINSNAAYPKCELSNSNDLLTLIKNNHPTISRNFLQGEAIERLVNVAEQRPNPELDIESTIGDSIEGDIYTTSVSLKHTFELGGKRSSRIGVAESSINFGKTSARFNNENAIIDSVLKLHRLRQVYELVPIYQEALGAFNKILKTIKRRKSLSPEQQVEGETLDLAVNDYKLKIAQLNAEKINLSRHLSFFMGSDCVIPREVLPTDVNIKETFNLQGDIEKYSKLQAAKFAVDLAQANLELEKSNSYPNLQIGPTYEYEKLNIRNTNTVGIALTMDLPIFNTNSGGKAKAAKDLSTAKLNLSNVNKESKLDRYAWVAKYNQFKESLKTIANKEKLERKHQKIESLFKRGIISTALVILNISRYRLEG
jgi:cobalt-zinc-cadmium efflux system outer membrane protein